MPLTRRAISRVSSPLKMRLSPHEISDVSMENSAIMAIAERPVFGTRASATIRRFTAGVVATTYPPMMIITICMVNGTSVQKFFTPWMASLPADSCRQQSGEEDDQNAQQREHQRIGKPALAPGGKRQPKARQPRFPAL